MDQDSASNLKDQPLVTTKTGSNSPIPTITRHPEPGTQDHIRKPTATPRQRSAGRNNIAIQPIPITDTATISTTVPPKLTQAGRLRLSATRCKRIEHPHPPSHAMISLRVPTIHSAAVHFPDTLLNRNIQA